jgi:hypothetical protein
MSDHCILILAHRLPWLFERLAASLAPHFAVIAHVDASAEVDPFRVGAVEIMDKRHRIRWGSYAMVAAALDLLRHGLKNENLGTFTLISGDTFPVSAPAAIAELLGQRHDRIDSNIVQPTSETLERIRNVYLPDTRLGELRPGTHFLHRHLDEDLTEVFAEAERARRERPEFLASHRYAKGSQWWSLTRATAEKIVELAENDRAFVDAFRFSAIPDEAFFQSAMVKLGLHETAKPGLVYAKWDTVPAPYTFEATGDAELLRSQPRPFARKFGDNSGGLIQRVEDELWASAFSYS